MAQNITLMGANYSAVPAVTLPKTAGGTATFFDTTDADMTAAGLVKDNVGYGPTGKVVGTLVINKYYTGSSSPSSSLGNDGDIYLKVT